MVDVPFLSYQFETPGVTTGAKRNLPDRLKDVVSVKDWGAVGDGVANDHDAIQQAIVHALESPGKILVYIPAGTYYLGSNASDITNMAPRLYIGGTIRGAGRTATILRGNFNTGPSNRNPWRPPPDWNPNVSAPLGNPSYLVQNNVQLVSLSDLTIWNESQVEGSGAFFSVETRNAYIRNCHFIGTIGMAAPQAAYGTNIHDCKFTCSIPKIRADASSLDSAFVTVGLYPGQGSVINCHLEGFHVGICAWGQGQVHGCMIRRCIVGFEVGMTIVPGQTSTIVSEWNCNGYSITSCLMEGCASSGIHLQQSNDVVIASNIFTSGKGCYTDVDILGMTYNTGTHVVTVSTTNPHNITALAKIKLTLATAGWLPDGNTNGIVTVATVPTSTTFTYAGPTATPAPFTTGSWNYPAFAAIRPLKASCTAMIANVFADDIIGPDILPSPGGQQLGGGAESGDITCMSMTVPHGIMAASTGPPDSQHSWRYIQCWTPGQPTPTMTFAQLPISTRQREGEEFVITDGQKSGGGAATFGDTVAGGGSQRIKIRLTGPDYTGGNWTRVG